jgi:hypothetical protein
VTINSRHRKHFKSGSCLSQHELGHSELAASRKFRRLLEFVREQRRRAAVDPESSIERLERPAHFDRRRPSLFRRAVAKVRRLIHGDELAAA